MVTGVALGGVGEKDGGTGEAEAPAATKTGGGGGKCGGGPPGEPANGGGSPPGGKPGGSGKPGGGGLKKECQIWMNETSKKNKVAYPGGNPGMNCGGGKGG